MIFTYYRGHEKDARGNTTIRGNFYGYYYSICTEWAHTIYALFLTIFLLHNHDIFLQILTRFRRLSPGNAGRPRKMKENL